MFGKKKQQEDFSTLALTMNKLINSKDAAEKRIYEYEGKMHQYHNQLIEEYERNETLTRENEHLKMLFNKEQDTQVIKYNGKLWQIASGTHSFNPGEADTLTVDAVLVSEVNEDGESEM